MQWRARAEKEEERADRKERERKRKGSEAARTKQTTTPAVVHSASRDLCMK
jgi:hypothetical protein